MVAQKKITYRGVADEQGWPFPKSSLQASLGNLLFSASPRFHQSSTHHRSQETFFSKSFYGSSVHGRPWKFFSIHQWQWHFHLQKKWHLIQYRISDPVPSSMGSAASLEAWYLQGLGQLWFLASIKIRDSSRAKRMVIFWISEHPWGENLNSLSIHIIPDLCVTFVGEPTLGGHRSISRCPWRRTSDQHAAFGLRTCPSAKRPLENWGELDRKLDYPLVNIQKAIENGHL